MDWYSWLSKTNLEPTLVYEYGLAFLRNELQVEDLSYLNHDFLQSIGVSVAKHRLEILKLATKDARGRTSNGFSRLVLAINKTRKLFTLNIPKWGGFRLSPYGNQCSTGAPRKVKENQVQADQKTRNVMWSGPLPLDTRVQDNFMMASRSHSASGPLDGKMMQERFMCGSPMISRSICRSPTIDRLGLSPKPNTQKFCDHHDGVQSLWSLMFQDMKPT